MAKCNLELKALATNILKPQPALITTRYPLPNSTVTTSGKPCKLTAYTSQSHIALRTTTPHTNHLSNNH
jgi:hypothetical protein